MVKEKPSRVLYVQENINQTEEEREKDRQWKMAKKAAAQLGINITILNLEKNLQNQEQKIEALENALLNKEENKENLTEEKIIEKLIVEFENNRVTMRYVNNNLKEKYFTDEKRDKLYNLIENKIKTLKNSNPQEAEKLMESYIGVLQNEFNKAYTITGNAVNGLQDFEYIKNRLNAQNVQEASNEEIQNKKLQDIYKRYNINLSDIEFVNKMIENKTQNMDEVRE